MDGEGVSGLKPCPPAVADLPVSQVFVDNETRFVVKAFVPKTPFMVKPLARNLRIVKAPVPKTIGIYVFQVIVQYVQYDWWARPKEKNVGLQINNNMFATHTVKSNTAKQNKRETNRN